MDEATKKKFCHLLMFDISEPSKESKETSPNNDGSDLDDRNPCSNDSSQETSAAATTIASTSLASKSTKRKPRAKKPKRTPRPPNAFILYRKAKQPDVVAQDKNLTNAEVSKVISKMWWKEKEEERFQWEKRADRMKLKHMQDYPDYVYQPKKPGTKKRKSAQRGNKSIGASSTFSTMPVSEKSFAALPDETITAIAEVAFAVGNKCNHSIPSTSPASPVSNIPSPPSSSDRSPTTSSDQSPTISPQGILYNHRLNHRVNHMTFQQHNAHYAIYTQQSQHPPSPTEVYDITPQFLLPPSDNYISHGNFTSQQCFNPIEVTSYIAPHVLTNGNFDSFLDAQPVDKFPYFISQDTSTHTAYTFNNFTSVDNYANQSNSTGGVLLDELFNNNTTASSPIEDMETYFDDSHHQTCQYSNRRAY